MPTSEADLVLVEQLKSLIDERGIAWEGGPRTLKSLTDAVPWLVADVRRLRGLIKDMAPGAGERCLWCSRRGYVDHVGCPAFTESGEVR